MTSTGSTWNVSERNFDFALLFFFFYRHLSLFFTLLPGILYFLSPLKGPSWLSWQREYIEIFSFAQPRCKFKSTHTHDNDDDEPIRLILCCVLARHFDDSLFPSFFRLRRCCCVCVSVCVFVFSVLVSSEYVISIPILGDFSLWISVFSLRNFTEFACNVPFGVWNEHQRRLYDG